VTWALEMLIGLASRIAELMCQANDIFKGRASPSLLHNAQVDKTLLDS